MPLSPYYSHGGITIYHGDCREILPQLSVGTQIVTDPPYGMNHYESDRAVLTPDMLSDWQSRFDAVCVFGWPERLVEICVKASVVPDEWITWWPTNAACKSSNGKGARRESEHIAIFGQCQRVRGREYSGESLKMADHMPHQRGGFAIHDDGAIWGDVWTDPSPGILANSHLRLHPNEKPIEVMSRLLQMLYPGRIVDPFCGSGTTLHAAKKSGREAIGIEIEEKYCEIAANRLSQEVFTFS